METPSPVDVSKLKSILSNAKKIMKATDEQFKPKIQSVISERTAGSSSASASQPSQIYDERDEKEMSYNPQQSSYVPSNRDYTAEEVMSSNLPKHIKEAMIKNHIPRVSSMPGSFTLNGLEDLIEKPKAQTTKRIVNESINNGSRMITISEDELAALIDKKINENLAKLFAKTISEQSIKKTISTLIKEGKITKK